MGNSKRACSNSRYKRIKYVEENIAAANITLSQENIDLLESIIPLGTDTGDRYANMSGVNL